MTEFNPSQQLNLIDEMIMSAKKDLKDNGFHFLFWGWLVFVASLGFYLLQKFQVPNGAIIWFILPLGAVVDLLVLRKENKETRVKTWVDRVMKHIWTAFGACLFIVLVFQFRLGINTFPMVLLIYGVGTFLSGAVIQFRPLILGGIFCWALAIACFFISAENQLLLLCASLLGAYIIPGYILRSRFNVQ